MTPEDYQKILVPLVSSGLNLLVGAISACVGFGFNWLRKLRTDVNILFRRVRNICDHLGLDDNGKKK